MDKTLHKPELYENREISWLKFNERVFDEARDENQPLFERLKFFGIVFSNLDEFFMVRIASIRDQVSSGYTKKDIAGMTPNRQMNLLSKSIHQMVGQYYDYLNNELYSALNEEKYRFLTMEELTEEDKEHLEEVFDRHIYPVLTPLAVDSSRPFPLIYNKGLNIGILIEESEDEDGMYFATVQVPSILPRILRVKTRTDYKFSYVFLEEVIMLFIHKLFHGKKVLFTHPYRITRKGDVELREEDSEDLLKDIEKQIKKRKWGEVIRLEIDSRADKRLLAILREALSIHKEDIYRIDGPIDPTFLMKLPDLVKVRKGDLLFKPFLPQIPEDLVDEPENLFEAIQERDIMLHHPYESFDPVVQFIEEAAADPNVLAIKQTLYRVSGDSSIVQALAEAADRGKQVTVLVELKARFDEENNINWAKQLEKTGCHVIYGMVGVKTHSKITLVVRKEGPAIRRYVHLGTGNYNDLTATVYTDIGLLTCDAEIGEDASAFFNMLSGYSDPKQLKKMTVAPLRLRHRFLGLIEREIDNVNEGGQGKIILKMNALSDPTVIRHLYRASMAGVEIDLIIRGICCLKPGMPEVSENIRVRSIVGRYLEHSRIFWFYNNGHDEIFISSADMMERNLDRRIEIMVPVEDRRIHHRLKEILDIYLKDSLKARVLNTEGEYVRDINEPNPFGSQDFLRRRARQAYKQFLKERISMLQ